MPNPGSREDHGGSQKTPRRVPGDFWEARTPRSSGALGDFQDALRTPKSLSFETPKALKDLPRNPPALNGPKRISGPQYGSERSLGRSWKESDSLPSQIDPSGTIFGTRLGCRCWMGQNGTPWNRPAVLGQTDYHRNPQCWVGQNDIIPEHPMLDWVK